MVALLPEDVLTKEVLDWTGLHLFHATNSSCSQKVRIFLNLKGIRWASHPIDLRNNEHIKPYFLGINPRGLVPVLVDEGTVHIESNDILLHLERRFPRPTLIPHGMEKDAAALLAYEDDIHVDLRVISVRFMFALKNSPKSDEDLERYASAGAGTIQGVRDEHIDREIGFWKEFAQHGIGDERARLSAAKFVAAFNLVEDHLKRAPYILGGALSVVDIAWLVYAQRLHYAGYPLGQLHPHVAVWHGKLMSRANIARELTLPDAALGELQARHALQRKLGQSLVDICFADLIQALPVLSPARVTS